MVLIQGLDKINYKSNKLNLILNSLISSNPISNNHMIYRIKENIILSNKALMNKNTGHLIEKRRNRTKIDYIARE